ncbi:MAG: amidohydrolase family protein [Deltaproteobacteria bacterium]|nr:amidohydrolase family protein [Deltaproteobacteria bacterium]
MEEGLIIDSHSHFGPSLTLGIEVTESDLLSQMAKCGISYVVIIPFPSTAIASDEINRQILIQAEKVKSFIPYHYVREDFDREDFDPIPSGYYGGKWHWMRGKQDMASNYSVLKEKSLPKLIEKLEEKGKPLLFEEELKFTEIFVEMAKNLKVIIPHLGMLGGNPIDFLHAFKDKENVYFDTSLAPRETILKFCDTLGPERILFASDVPFGRMETELDKVLSLPLSHREKSLILSGNFIRLTGFNI